MTMIFNRKAHKKNIFPLYTTSGYFSFIGEQWDDSRKFSLETIRDKNTLLEKVLLQQPQVVILGVEQPLLSDDVLAHLSAVENRPTIVSLLRSNNTSLMTDLYDQGADRVVVIPDCSPRIFRALIGTLIKKDHYYPPYRINPGVQTINIGDTEIRLTKKTFDVAQYLFTNHGKLISKSRILKDIWGLDSRQCFTHRIEVHISNVRKLLALDGSHGWEIRVRRRQGYGIFHKVDF